MKRVRLYLPSALMGLALGYTLSQMGFANFNEVHAMLTLRDARLFAAFIGAVCLAIVGFRLAARFRHGLPERPYHPGIVPGAILFGIGWALTGVCPAAAFVQLGEGMIPAIITILAMGAGSWIASRLPGNGGARSCDG